MKKFLSIVTFISALIIGFSVNAFSGFGPKDCYFINDDCMGCGTCFDVCPVGAIYVLDNGQYEIANGINDKGRYSHPGYEDERCISCGVCFDVCPVGAIWAGEK